MKRAALQTMLLLIYGCGAPSFVATGDCANGGDCPDEILGTGANTSASLDGVPGSTPILNPGSPGDPGAPLSGQPPEFGRFLSPPPVLDSFAFSLFELTDAPELLSLFMDASALELSDPTNWVDGYTYLEFLCIDSGQSESACRQRYGFR